jgi:hypothetical protein
MSNESTHFKNNRKKEFREQLNYWRVNLESGLLRLIERIIFGFNVSDVLAGDIGQIQHLTEVANQIETRKMVEQPHIQQNRDESDRLSIEASTSQYIFKLKNARVDTITGLVVLDAGFVVDSTLAKWQKIIYRGGIGSSIKRTKRSKAKLFGNFMIMPHSPFYYHAVIDELPNLIRIRAEFPECNTVIINCMAPKWAIELLDYFKFKVHVVNEPALVVENLFAATAPRAVVKKNLNYLRENLNTQAKDVLLVSRKGTPRSDDHIERILAERIPKLELIDPGKLSVEEQIQVFSSAKIVIGLHGGALTNCVWMDKSSYVIEILNHAYRTSDYERLCRELGIRYSAIEINSLTSEEIASIVGKLIYDI